MDLKEKQEENILLYSTYTILYLNDTACNCIKDLSPYMQNKDKESKKIYGALMKRAKCYFDNINSLIGDKIEYFADYCSEMDDILYKPTLDFKTALLKLYKGLDDCEYYAQIEITRSIIGLSISVSNKIIEKASKITQNASWLKQYVLSDLGRIANNLSDWAYHYTPKDFKIDLNKQSALMDSFSKLSQAMVDFESFDKAYRKAIEYEKQRNENK